MQKCLALEESWFAVSFPDVVFSALLVLSVHHVFIFSSTALHCAASRGHNACIDVLRRQSATVDVVDRNKCTALFYAITLGNKQCTKSLLSAKANPNHVDDRGRK